MIPQNFIDELVRRSEIYDVVSGYVRLTKKGGNYFGLCPFHGEKTASFSVNQDKQIYHCFGCGKGGGVINFIMEIENLSFPEAVEFLARRVGMTVPEQTNDHESRRRARMLELNRDAARFFHAQLNSPGAERAHEYIASRRIGRKMVTAFGLGYAPDDYFKLTDTMRDKGYTDRELLDAGLVRQGKKGVFDTFRNRLMFPVIDVRGNVIGFSGRILGDGEPKYMNSPETLVFNKSRNLFALNLAKKSKCGYIILSEGNIDVVSLHQAGFDCAVASLGTSLTAEQARMISRYTNEVIIAYDNDNAGIKASQRAISILEKLDLKVRVLQLNGAKDPDEFIKLKGADAFRNLLEGAENQVDYRLSNVTAKYDLKIDEQKVEFLKEASELLAKLPGSVERQVYAMRVATLAGVSAEVVTAEVERRRKKLVKNAHRNEIRSEVRPEKQSQPAGKSIRYENPASAVAEEGVIRLLYLEPELIKEPLPSAAEFSSPVLAHMFDTICAHIREGHGVSTTMLSAVLSGEEMNLLVGIIQKPERLSSAKATLGDYTQRIKTEHARQNTGLDYAAIAAQKRSTVYDNGKNKKGYEG